MNNYTPYLIEYFKIPALVSNARLGKWDIANVFIDGKLLPSEEKMQYLIDHSQIAKVPYQEEEGVLFEYSGSPDTLLVISTQLPHMIVDKYKYDLLAVCEDADDNPKEKWIIFKLDESKQILKFKGELNNTIDMFDLDRRVFNALWDYASRMDMYTVLGQDLAREYYEANY